MCQARTRTSGSYKGHNPSVHRPVRGGFCREREVEQKPQKANVQVSQEKCTSSQTATDTQKSGVPPPAPPLPNAAPAALKIELPPPPLRPPSSLQGKHFPGLGLRGYGESTAAESWLQQSSVRAALVVDRKKGPPVSSVVKAERTDSTPSVTECPWKRSRCKKKPEKKKTLVRLLRCLPSRSELGGGEPLRKWPGYVTCPAVWGEPKEVWHSAYDSTPL